MDNPSEELAFLMRAIQQCELYKNYDARNRLVLQALGVAIELRMIAGIRIDALEPDWPVVYIELPTGQVSWHLKEHSIAYDGHSTGGKWERVQTYVRCVSPVIADGMDEDVKNYMLWNPGALAG